jgi:hypothetical protein
MAIHSGSLAMQNTRILNGRFTETAFFQRRRTGVVAEIDIPGEAATTSLG